LKLPARRGREERVGILAGRSNRIEERLVDILSFIRERAGDYDCPVCREPLAGCDLTLLRQDGSTFTVQVGCAQCHVTFVVVLQLRGDLPDAPPAAQEPTEPPRPPISADELLDLHETLRDFEGSFRELVGKAAPRDRSRIV
jgi:hypothetical protein